MSPWTAATLLPDLQKPVRSNQAIRADEHGGIGLFA
jgi:hypothetical protein